MNVARNHASWSDPQYVDGLISTLLSFQAQAEELIVELKEKVYLVKQKQDLAATAFSAPTPSQGAATVLEPFNLSKPRPKPLPAQPPPTPPLRSVLLPRVFWFGGPQASAVFRLLALELERGVGGVLLRRGGGGGGVRLGGLLKISGGHLTRLSTK